MRLKSIRYGEFEHEDRSWSLRETELGQVNLVVGRNSSGKTRMLNVIGALGKLLAKPGELAYESGNYTVTFANANSTLEYRLRYEKKKVTLERLASDGKVLLNRSGNSGSRMFFSGEKKDIALNIPPGDVAVASRRDSLQHPYLEPLVKWGSEVLKADFIRSLEPMGIASGKPLDEWEPPEEDYSALNVFIRGKKRFGTKFVEAVTKDMAGLDFHIRNVGITINPAAKLASQSQRLYSLFIQERGVRCELFQHEISAGMFRALSTIILLNYLKLSNSSACLVIDDVGEGLDFERSAALVKLLTKSALKHRLQLIMASNDRFIMDVVPLEHWIVLVRRGGSCHAVTAATEPSHLREFKMTGLRNFDYFASKFWESRDLK